jgi:hypothetical protein
MARIRTIKPDFWRDESLSMVSPEAALLAIGLLNHADDEGYFNAHPKLIESDIFPLRELSNTITVLIDELHGISYITLFQGSDGKRYGHICNFSKHQVINKKNPSKIKDLCKQQEDYRTTTVMLPVGMEGKRIGKEKEKKVAKATATDVAFVLPDWIPSETWEAFLAMRKKIKKPPTDYALKLLIDKLTAFKAKGQNIKAVLEKSITSGWQDVFEIHEKQPFANKFDVITTTTPPPAGQDAALKRILEDDKKAVPPSLETLEKLAALRKKIA